MPRSQEQLDAAIRQFAEQITALNEVLQSAIVRLAALPTSSGAGNETSANSNSISPETSSAEDSLTQDIREGVLQIVNDGVRISNVDELQSPARFG